MSEVCLECWNKMNESNIKKWQVLLSKENDLCEDCCEVKPVIVRYRKFYIVAEYIRDLFVYWIKCLKRG